MYIENINDADSTSALKSALELLIHHGTDRTFASGKTRDALLKKADLVTSADCAHVYFRCFLLFANTNEESRMIVAKRQVHNTLTSIFMKNYKQLDTPAVCTQLIETLSFITFAENAEECFASPVLCKILTRISHHFIRYKESVDHMLLTIVNLTSSKVRKGSKRVSGRKIFATESVRNRIFCQLAPTAASTESGRKYFVQAVANITDYLPALDDGDDDDEQEEHNENIISNNNNNTEDKTKLKEEPFRFPNKSFIRNVINDITLLESDPIIIRNEPAQKILDLKELRLALAMKGVDKLVSTAKKLTDKERECTLLYGQLDYYQDQLERRIDNEVLESAKMESTQQMSMMSGRRRQRENDDDGEEKEVVVIDDDDDDW